MSPRPAGRPAAGGVTARLAAVVLGLEALLVLFATLVAQTLSGLPPATVWAAGGLLSLACVVLAGLARRRVGILGGTLLQAVVIATGAWVPAMLMLGIIFAGLWFWLLSIGARIDRDRARLAGGAPPPDVSPPASR